jgi:hypothetical protein
MGARRGGAITAQQLEEPLPACLEWAARNDGHEFEIWVVSREDAPLLFAPRVDHRQPAPARRGPSSVRARRAAGVRAAGQVLNLATRKEGMLDTVDLRAGWALVRLLGRRERNAKGAREFVLRRS